MPQEEFHKRMKESSCFGAASHVGIVRKENQDSVYVGRNKFNQIFAVVCDGLGGYTGGGIASKIVMEIFKYAFLTADFSKMNERQISHWFDDVLQCAKLEIYKTITNHNNEQNDHLLDRMATTIVCSLIVGQKIYTFWVGDSRAYLVDKNQESWQITRDHNLYNYLLSHKVTKENIEQSKDNLLALTNIVGSSFDERQNSQLNVEKFGTNVNKIDNNLFLLLCSDGFYNFVDPKEFYILLNEHSKKKHGNLVLTAGELLKVGMQRLSNDNLTVAIVDLRNAQKPA